MRGIDLFCSLRASGFPHIYVLVERSGITRGSQIRAGVERSRKSARSNHNHAQYQEGDNARRNTLDVAA